MGLAGDRAFVPVSRALVGLSDETVPRDLFRLADVPESSGYRVLRFYEFHDAIQVRGTIEVDARRVIALQGGLRADRAIPDQKMVRGPDLGAAVLALEEAGIPCAIGFQTAANMHAYFEPGGPHTLYVDRPPRAAEAARRAKVARKVLMDHAPPSKHYPYDLHVAEFGRLGLQRDHRGPMTDPIQTLLDLAVHHGTAAHREFLYDQLVKQEVVRD